MSASDETSLVGKETPSVAFMPYPASRLAPRIVPQDLTNFKTRGIGRVERELQQELIELREKYLVKEARTRRMVTHFG